MTGFDRLQGVLPYALYSLAKRFDAEEMRLMRGKCVILVKEGVRTVAPLVCDAALFDETLVCLTEHSFYSYGDCIRRGYIPLPGGARAGVSGRAVCEDGRILTVKDIDFLCLRFPRPVPGAAKELFDALYRTSFRRGALVYSPPGVGKTTVLRELARTVSSPPYLRFTALIDERGELSYDLDRCPALFTYLHYPKRTALGIALRTARPEIMIIDEIGYEEIDELRACARGGIALAASIHAGSLEELQKNDGGARLLSSGLFGLAAGLTRDKGVLRTEITDLDAEAPRERERLP